ncbi:MAG: iron-sulfur cluster assembly accessory protein [Buchnera aphidicola (Periphyllus lyropictus)]|uniref:HesB/IscA family protein n=1 Tax=Buchnera aphidicola TaxID=9 RepID=UPI001EC97B9F|nr:iron-sulfur cluster assembly accessory protein [Buchnera aphidicola]NIH16714.1 iron-sulfur cluster assembly accessory protein [Buchnera aphidicola (Periphyllus lyropictus)]USS94619.1 iron-sulfur cluster assembly accessory protein [Buchnera aphidicola (Periphyllus lyropictus)]
MKKYFLKPEKKKFIGIFITSKALNKILKIYKKKKNIIGIKINIKKTGCAGFKYTMKYCEKKKKSEISFSNYNISIFLPKKKIKLLDGLIIDFINKNFHKNFEFYHKNSKKKCGCGESFNIKKT